MNALWTISLKAIETHVRVGIHEHEKNAAQRLLVDVEVQADLPLRPTAIDECFDYDLVYDHVTKAWSQRSHVDLLEHLALDLVTHIFGRAENARCVKVTVAKPDIFAKVEWAGVSLSWSRADYEAAKGKGLI